MTVLVALERSRRTHAGLRAWLPLAGCQRFWRSICFAVRGEHPAWPHRRIAQLVLARSRRPPSLVRGFLLS